MLIALCAVFMIPVVFIVLTSLMPEKQTLSGALWPHPFRWQNYVDVFKSQDMLRFAVNTLTIAVLSTIGTVFACVPVAYALARLRWRGRQFAFILVLATFMLPSQVTIIPLYIVFVKLHWINTFLPLIVPSFFGDAFSIFLLRQFFLTIPEEFSDAARVDGASEFQIMFKVIMPLVKPAIAAIAIFNFLFAWNDFFAPLLFLQDNSKYTLALWLSTFRGLHHVQWNLTLAASMMVTIPVIIIFFLAQRVFLEGITLTGVKG